jgi:hypothetical protein
MRLASKRESTFVCFFTLVACSIVVTHLNLHFLYEEDARQSNESAERVGLDPFDARRQVAYGFTLPHAEDLHQKEALSLLTSLSTVALEMSKHLDHSSHTVDPRTYPLIWPAARDVRLWANETNVAVSETLSIIVNSTALSERKAEILEILSRLGGFTTLVSSEAQPKQTASKQFVPSEPQASNAYSRANTPQTATQACEGAIRTVVIQVEHEGEPEITPENEAYTVLVWAQGALIKGASVWGALHGLRTFASMVQSTQTEDDIDTKLHAKNTQGIKAHSEKQQSHGDSGKGKQAAHRSDAHDIHDRNNSTHTIRMHGQKALRGAATLEESMRSVYDDSHTHKTKPPDRYIETKACSKFVSAPVYVRDEPRFAHRGFLLDTAHVFMPVRRSHNVRNADDGYQTLRIGKGKKSGSSDGVLKDKQSLEDHGQKHGSGLRNEREHRHGPGDEREHRHGHDNIESLHDVLFYASAVKMNVFHWYAHLRQNVVVQANVQRSVWHVSMYVCTCGLSFEWLLKARGFDAKRFMFVPT